MTYIYVRFRVIPRLLTADDQSTVLTTVCTALQYSVVRRDVTRREFRSYRLTHYSNPPYGSNRATIALLGRLH